VSQLILQHAAEWAWCHWTLLGIRGVAPAPVSAIDLEALIAFTPWVAAEDPRLAAEAADWCARIGHRFVSQSRLRRIQRLIPEPSGRAPVDLFALVSDRAVAGRFRGSGKSQAPTLAHAALLQLRARMIFGVGARADVLARLAMLKVASDDDAVPLRRIHPPGYARQSIAPVLDELTAGRLLRRSTAGRVVVYRMRDPAVLRALLTPLPTRDRNWVARLFAIGTVLATWSNYGSRRSYAIELAKALEQASTKTTATKSWPTFVGSSSEIIDAVDQWALALLDTRR
jgi:hypothetical protein